jgi:hypothetical protein
VYTTKAQVGWMNQDAAKFGLKKITLAEVKKAIKVNGKWEGYFAPNNVNQYHITANQHLGVFMDIDSLEELEKRQNAYLFHMDQELGNGIHYYEKL